MDFLAAEIERKQKQIAENEVTSNKKYFRRGELAAKQAEDYKKRRKEKCGDEANDIQEPKKKRKSWSNINEEEKSLIPREDVVKRLRERGEPVRLFGESDEEACQRLRRIEMLQPDVNKGLRNDFKAAMERVDQQYLDELIQQQDGETSGSTDIQVKDDGTTLDDIKEMATGMGKGDAQRDQQVILKYLQFLMQCWAMDLNDKPQEEKRKLEGKIASATHSQTQGYLKPLFRKLKYKKTPPDILEALVDIVSSMLTGEYVKANDAYLQMAIGNAPWPIGVTMVGIHARTGREKIFSQHVAHVLNDETQRKYIQGLKRLMTYCQKRFPVDPSKSVEYKALA